MASEKQPKQNSDSLESYDQALADEADSHSNVDSSSKHAASEEGPLEVADRVAELEREVLRLRAELENYRKRMQRESEQQLKYANLPLMRELLDVLDNLYRAVEASKANEGENEEALRKGVVMVTEQLANTLGRFGCHPIEAVGNEFDPNFHEAIAQIPSQEHPRGVVAQEVNMGYRLHDRVVRPSNVVVSSGTPDEKGSAPNVG